MNTYLQILWIRKYMLLTTYVPYIFILGPLGKILPRTFLGNMSYYVP